MCKWSTILSTIAGFFSVDETDQLLELCEDKGSWDLQTENSWVRNDLSSLPSDSQQR